MTGRAGWLVVRVRPQFTARAVLNMERQGCEVYAPRALVRTGRARVLRPQPLFPGYVFARPSGERWAFLRGTYGVLGVLMSAGEAPALVPAAEVARLRAREGPDGLVRLASSEFRVGERVQVEKGALSFDAIVDGMAGPDRVFVLMEVLGAERRVEIDVADVTKL